MQRDMRVGRQIGHGARARAGIVRRHSQLIANAIARVIVSAIARVIGYGHPGAARGRLPGRNRRGIRMPAGYGVLDRRGDGADGCAGDCVFSLQKGGERSRGRGRANRGHHGFRLLGHSGLQPRIWCGRLRWRRHGRGHWHGHRLECGQGRGQGRRRGARQPGRHQPRRHGRHAAAHRAGGQPAQPLAAQCPHMGGARGGKMDFHGLGTVCSERIAYIEARAPWWRHIELGRNNGTRQGLPPKRKSDATLPAYPGEADQRADISTANMG